MKLLWIKTVVSALAGLLIAFSSHAGETKKVCHAEKDRKGKETQVCREVKVHKKLDGTKVPPK